MEFVLEKLGLENARGVAHCKVRKFIVTLLREVNSRHHGEYFKEMKILTPIGEKFDQVKIAGMYIINTIQ